MIAFPMAEIERLNKTYPLLMPQVRKAVDENDYYKAAMTAVAGAGYGKEEFLDEFILTKMLVTWEKSRVVYNFDSELTNSLFQQAKRTSKDEKIPTELLRNLPYQCTAIEFPPIRIFAQGEQNLNTVFIGKVFVQIMQPNSFLDAESFVTCWQLENGKWTTIHFPISEATIDDNYEFMKRSIQQQGTEESMQYTEENFEYESLISLFAMQFILYLQAENTDLRIRPAVKTKKKSGKSPKKPKVKTVDVGVHVGRMLRKARYEYEKKESTGTGTKKRPHSRRGHWHHYWTGKKDDLTNRKLVLKWVAPTFVNGTTETTTVVKVGK